MKILILGGTGAMGAPLANILASRNHEVYITSRREYQSKDNLHYILGDAHNIDFLGSILDDGYDKVVDFLVYTTSEFEQRIKLLLEFTTQYVFLSTARVYAESSEPIVERSPRLLDICEDKMFLNSDEYPIAKARQENILFASSKTNWTIVRPYITYNVNRLQLGVYEKEQWLYRALKGKTIVFSADIAAHITTLTYAHDVAQRIACLLEDKSSCGEVFNLISPDSLKWEEVLMCYLRIIKNMTGISPNVYLFEESHALTRSCLNEYAIKYDRLFDRIFDSHKMELLCNPAVMYTSAECGLERCLAEFLDGDRDFQPIGWKWEAYADKLTGEITPINDIPGAINKLKYLICRFTPYLYFSN